MNETAIETDTNADLARERVRANFHSLTLWDSKWVWDWSSESLGAGLALNAVGIAQGITIHSK